MAAVVGAETTTRVSLHEHFRAVRARSVEIANWLQPEDCVVQSMPDVSPTKWHLAHVTWFFEQFVLLQHATNYRSFDEQFLFLFNSYYESAGAMHARPQRGLLSRPTLAQIMRYREHVDAAILRLIEASHDPALENLITLGLEHERQHQELMLTDIKHVLSCNPMRPAMREDLSVIRMNAAVDDGFTKHSGGITTIGASTDTTAFCYDNETPTHDVLLRDFAIANRLVSNRDYRRFIEDGGYSTASLWLSDGWATVQTQDWRAPLYWNLETNTEFTLGGERPIDLDAPVSHISFYEADAFARWSGARLPSEAEWEVAARQKSLAGNTYETDCWQPMPGTNGQWYGDVWEWTACSYAPYPGFRPLEGSLGEYNGKFMCNQMVVRGGSCVSARDHLRPTYRSFFYPDARWQFLGLRLARDA
ncbi:MAG: ergothioneine biosynthesis protein EgtB [Pseudomonadota bacterium]